MADNDMRRQRLAVHANHELPAVGVRYGRRFRDVSPMVRAPQPRFVSHCATDKAKSVPRRRATGWAQLHTVEARKSASKVSEVSRHDEVLATGSSSIIRKFAIKLASEQRGGGDDTLPE